MKAKLLLAAVVALAATALSAGGASAAGTTCTYKMRSEPIYATAYGPDNSPVYCRMMTRIGYRWYGRAPGPIRCVFSMNVAAVYMQFRSPSATIGRFACDEIEASIHSWTRIR